jgi:hypothetical protein
MAPLRERINKEVSPLDAWNPIENKNSLNQLYQARGACFKPYRDLWRRHTWDGSAGSTNPGGCAMYTFS